MQQSPKELVILHASDVHIASHRIYQLRRWLKLNNQRVDVVLLSGDLADMPIELCYTAPQQEIEAQHKLLDKILEEFLPLADKVYYIPGNHDAITTFTTTGQSLDKSPCNVHMRQVTIEQGLHLLGLGGSVPGYQQGQQIWEGFPYRTEQEYSEDVSRLLDPVFLLEESTLKPSDTVILMTHVGPHQSSTTVSHIDPQNPIVCGSPSLYNYLCKAKLQKHVILNIHGHTHDASGQATIGNTAVINPGPLMEGHFGLYTLIQTHRSPSWKLFSSHLYRLYDQH